MADQFEAAAGLIAEKAVPAPRNHAPRPAAAAPRPTPRTSTNSRPHNVSSGPVSKRAAGGSSSNAYGLPPAIAGLVESLPTPEEGWTAAERDKFLTTFKAVLDFAIPVIAKKPASSAADEVA